MNTILTTPRLILRELSPGDKNALSDVLSNPESMKFYPHPFSESEVEGWIERNIKRYSDFGFGLWGVVLKETNELIGDCGITYQNIDGKTLPEIGYHINPEYCGNDYASEAAQACKKYAFEKLRFPAIYSYMYAENIPSRRVAEKNGMKIVKTYINNELEIVVYSITNQF